MEWFVTKQELESVKALLVNEGFNTGRYKNTFLRRRIQASRHRSGAKTHNEYLKMLKKSSITLQKLINSFSINVTRFFRNYETFERLETKFFAQMVEQKRAICKNNEFIIKVWSIGCANGSEPYTLAILFSRMLGDLAQQLVRIVGTDYNPAHLEYAQKGVYHTTSLEEVPPAFLHQYFTKQSSEYYQIDSQIKQMVQFRFHDLLKDKPLGKQDIIVCRNVLIYFSREAQLRIFEELAKSLKTHGLLILGRTEVLPFINELPFKITDTTHKVYRKLGIDVVTNDIGLR